jgi:hypothetical protein
MLLIASTHHELVEPIVGIALHDVPKDGLTANLYHWLGLILAFFADSRAEATRKKYNLHRIPAFFIS